ncbi:MAG TPA: HD domain-containing protein [Blastocatellia bacterium]|jgi:(p)ppGpp synthase/HD superfamily hydrolase|nr:HD domain-containing protein [Blastocatellia bacterium]
MIYERNYEYLAGRLTPHLNPQELRLVGRAYEVAETAHAGQMRDEGTPYIVHPVRVAVSLADELEIYSPRLICGALMHDVIEDSPVTRDDIAETFGEDIAHVVWLLTKFEDVSLAAYLQAIEDAADTGAPLVKLCDRLDNLRFLAHSPKAEKKRRYIRTTEAFYLPLAARTNRYLHGELRRWLEEARRHVKTVTGDAT